jgi:hypothetical protein
MNRNGILKATVLGVLALTLGACGSENSASTTDQAKAMNAVLMKMNTLQSDGDELTLRRLGGVVREARSRVGGQAILAQFAQEAGQTVRFEDTTIDDGEIRCILSTTSTDSVIQTTMNCETLRDDTMACGSTTYTMKSGGTIDMIINTTVSGEDMTIAFAIDMNANIAGGAFGDAGTAFDCNYGFEFSAAELEAISSSGAGANLDCDDIDFSCTIGGTAIDCNTMKTTFSEEASSCS